MADAAVEWLLEKLQHLLLHEADLIRDAKTQVENLEIDLRLFRASFKDSTTKPQKDDHVWREFVRQAREIIYEAEDVIDGFVAQAAQSRSKNCFLRAFQWPVKLRRFSEEVENVRAKVRNICSDKGMFKSSLRENEERKEEILKAPPVRQDNVVGFRDEQDALIGYLTEETGRLDVITIVGMPGIGKTTLASKIFRDPHIEFEFPIRVWIHVSNNFTDKDVFLAILRTLIPITDDVTRKSAEELAQKVVSHLERGKFLIIMDDVWSADDWDRLRIALPASNKMGKVLITTCNEEVGRHANRFRLPHKVRLLTESESWSLLQLEVFGEHECPPELENIGKLIAKQCDGLPLAVVLMGGILIQRDYPSSDTMARKNAWIKACQDVPKYRNQKFYDDLPKHLQICFLYFGIFPPDFEIPILKLIALWMAEGFIRQRDGVSLEETAENYLENLINRHLVEVDQIKSNGKVKTCRIHRMLHDFCKIQAGKEMENVLQEIKFRDGDFEPRSSELSIYRRLCIHSNVFGFLSSKPFGPHVRSLVSFSKDEINLPPENSSAIPTAFKLLRVLDVKPIRFSKIPSGLYQLVHLRYLVLSFNLAVLPTGFSMLWNMQTLIVNTTSRTLEIKADIWMLTQLRHFKTNASATLPKARKEGPNNQTLGTISSKSCTEELLEMACTQLRHFNTNASATLPKAWKEGPNIQTLGTISPKSCTEELLEMACNLKKLGIRGQLSLILGGNNGSFDCLGRLVYLEKLKLINDVFLCPPSEGRLHSLPPAYKFPPRLRSLTLADTFLDWGQIFILGLLEKLEVLKLKDNAFVGQNWVTDDGGFRSLEVLHIGRTDLVIWVASAYHFPKLTHLELHNCEVLREVPIELADIASLQRLDLFRTKLAAASANKILEKKEKYLEEKRQKYLEGQSTKAARAFKLSIYPPMYDRPY